MLKYLFFLIFTIPVAFKKQSFWLVQNFMFLVSFLFIVLGYSNNFFCGMSYMMGSDFLSYGLILLSFWICTLMIMASDSIFKMNNYYKLFLVTLLSLMIFLLLTFGSSNLLMFYISFESSLIPTLFLVLGWGYQPERMQAGVYLLFYTLLASLPMMISILWLGGQIGSLNFYMMSYWDFMKEIVYISMILAFFVKMPMFLVHLWLPKAHVEAPISGSMILAGILLKLGGYGLLRVYSFLLMLGMKFNYLFISISLVGGVLVSLNCLRQTDLKSLIAYSSVAHMGLVLGGLLTLSYWGLSGSYCLMIAHGLCSSGLFCLANMSYERLGSRSLLLNRGLLNFMPGLSLWWFLLCASNMAAPPTLNLLSEISLLNSIVSWSWLTMIMLSLLSFFSASYTLYLYAYSQHGKMIVSLFSSNGALNREFLLLLLHWLPLNYLILKSDMTIIWL